MTAATPYDYWPRCGDVGFTGGPNGGVISEAILRFTTSRGEPRTSAHHQFQVTGRWVVEALGELKHRKVIRRLFDERRTDCENSGSFIIVVRPTLTESQREVLRAEARRLVGRRYGYVEIVLKAMDGILKRFGLLKGYKQLFSRLGGLRASTMICSRVSNQCLVRAGALPKDAVHWAPDDTFDFALSEGWEVVCMSENSAGYWFPQSRGEK